MIVFIGSLLSFMKFGDQTSKKVHDVRKVCLETTLYVLSCFVEFCVFLSDETYVGGPKIVYEHIRVEICLENIPKDKQKVLEEGQIKVAKTAKGPTDGRRRTVDWSTPRRWRT